MKFVQFTYTSLALAIFVVGCTKGSSQSSTPVDEPPVPIIESQPNFAVRENGIRNLGQYVSGIDDAAISCRLTDVPNSVLGKLINIEASWKILNPEPSQNIFYRVKIESQSPRDILPGKNSFDFVDAQVRLYKSKLRPPTPGDFETTVPDEYSCDIVNFEKQGQRLSGRIMCYKNNVYHGYNLRLTFVCPLT